MIRFAQMNELDLDTCLENICYYGYRAGRGSIVGICC